MTVSKSARRFRARRELMARLRRTSPATILTVASLALIFLGIVGFDSRQGVACLVIGSLLLLLTPIGAGLRILIRGR